jgi:hypothetical protein
VTVRRVADLVRGCFDGLVVRADLVDDEALLLFAKERVDQELHHYLLIAIDELRERL